MAVLTLTTNSSSSNASVYIDKQGRQTDKYGNPIQNSYAWSGWTSSIQQQQTPSPNLGAQMYYGGSLGLSQSATNAQLNTQTGTTSAQSMGTWQSPYGTIAY